MTVYLSGPMRGYPQDNWPAFTAAAADLRAVGYEVLSPAEHTASMGYDPSAGRSLPDPLLRQALRWDCEAVLRSDAVVVLDGWAASRGASAEVALAVAAGMPVWPLLAAVAAAPGLVVSA